MTNYKTMNKAELKALAQQRNVEVDEDATNKEIAEALEKAENTVSPDNDVVKSDDVSDDQPDNAPVVAGDKADEVNDSDDKEEDVPDATEDNDKVVVKMTSNNSTYSVANLKFTKQHPFHTVKPDLADYLISTGSFKKASSDEVAEYYK